MQHFRRRHVMCLTQREHSYYHVTQARIKHILHIVGDFDIKINHAENTNIFGVRREHLTTLMDMCQIKRVGYWMSSCYSYRNLGLSICPAPSLSLLCLLCFISSHVNVIFYNSRYKAVTTKSSFLILTLEHFKVCHCLWCVHIEELTHQQLNLIKS